MRRTQDSQRLAQKFSLGRGAADDLISLARTIEMTQEILSRLKSHTARKKNPSLGLLLQKLDIPLDLAKSISDAIDEEGLLLQQKIQETETAELAAMAASMVELEQTEDLPVKKSMKEKVQLCRETDTSGYFERTTGLQRVEPWLMLRTLVHSSTLICLSRSCAFFFIVPLKSFLNFTSGWTNSLRKSKSSQRV